MLFDQSIPLYYQIENILRQRILSGEYGQTEAFPTEDQLTNEFKVSRITVRSALAALSRDGLIVRRRGKGTIVTDAIQDGPPTRLSGFIEDIIAMGIHSTVKILNFDFVKCPINIARMLDLKANQRPLRIEKIRYIDEKPFSHIINYVPPDIGKQIKQEDIVKYPLLQILENNFRIRIISGFQEMTATVADPAIASFLEIMVGAPLLKNERTIYSSKHRPVEHIVACYRADRYKYSVNLQRERSAGHRYHEWVVVGRPSIDDITPKARRGTSAAR
jgi:GntR family transcriptional regulator